MNKKIPTGIAIGIILFISVVIGGFIWIGNKNQEKLVNNKQIINKADKIVQNNQSQEGSNGRVYFGSGMDGMYSFVNILTQAKEELIPSGYEIVSQHRYGNNPQFLIFKKDNELYTYSVKNEKVQKIENGALRNNEEVVLYPSLTEEGRFYLVINTMKNEPEGSMYEAVPISSRKYFLDIDENKMEDANNISLPGVATFSGCFAYDSKYARFFIWRCGEGIGSAIPLSVYSVTDKKQWELIGVIDFGQQPAESINIEQGNGNLMAMSKSKDGFSKIIVITPTENINKDTFVVSENVKSQLDEIYPYSNLLIKNKKTIVIGGNDFILLMRFNYNNEITESKYLLEPAIYANFIFTDGQKIYYKSKNQIRIVDLDNWVIEKNIPYEENTEEINIFFQPQ